MLGVDNDAARALVEELVERAGIPAPAVTVEVVPPVYLLQTLASSVRPVPGGVQIRYNAPDQPWCTIGPNVSWITTGQTYRGFLVNSHCSKAAFHVDPSNVTHYWQAFGSGSLGHIGNEWIDPPLFSCHENFNGCRNSDAAMGLYASGVADELGYLARPDGRNTGSINIDSNLPRFQITSAAPYSIEGEILDKVGRTTGWTGGYVVDGCVTVAVNQGQFSIRCAMLVSAGAAGGDSGSPVFADAGNGDVQLRGTAFGGTGECYFAPDPVYSQSVRYCDHFVASNLGGITMDLNPGGIGWFSYW